ncbi:MAG TPA: glutaredoxin family protein [Smithellaceae bacterium]|nr:glutaredoxin family protein [Smithellaceae bacterium]HRS88985.1 glutaredoxin family protein [Smithellaceae bacterium]HRV25601.1 glutaredoxin family protein [Smithellaceae bacterium]
MHKRVIIMVFLVTLFFAFTSSYAQFYTWEDEEGVTHITNYPPPPNAIPKKMQVHKFDSGGAPTEQEKTEQKEDRKPEVVLYTKNECPDCDKAREFLQAQNVGFTEYNMDNDPDAAARRKSIDDSEEVPFAIINRNHVYGFSESVYNRVLKLFP